MSKLNILFNKNKTPEVAKAETKQPDNSGKSALAAALAGAKTSKPTGGLKLNLKLPQSQPAQPKVEEKNDKDLAKVLASVKKEKEPEVVDEQNEDEEGEEKEETSTDISADEFVYEGQPEAFSDPAMQEIKDALEVLKNSFDEPNILATAMSNCISVLQRHPDMQDNLGPEDVGLLVRALRNSYSSVSTTKMTRKEKRMRNAAEVEEASDALAELLGAAR